MKSIIEERNLVSKVCTAIMVVSLLIGGTSLFAQNTSFNDQSAIISTYQNSKNAIERRKALHAISDIVRKTGSTSWIKDLLAEALKDPDPIVVEEAVFQIGNHEIRELIVSLLSLYRSCETRFHSYGPRVQYAIIPVLGKVKGEGTDEFLQQLLQEDQCSDMGQFILDAIQELNNPRLLPAVRKYRDKITEQMNLLIAENNDPIFYSRHKTCLAIAEEIEKSLISQGGK